MRDKLLAIGLAAIVIALCIASVRAAECAPWHDAHDTMTTRESDIAVSEPATGLLLGVGVLLCLVRARGR